MFQIIKIPSSGSLVQCLAKITKMFLSCPFTWTRSVLWQHIVTRCVCVCVVHFIWRHSRKTVPPCTVNYTHAHRVRFCCHNTDHVHVNGHDRTIFVISAKYNTRLPDDGSSVIRNVSEHF